MTRFCRGSQPPLCCPASASFVWRGAPFVSDPGPHEGRGETPIARVRLSPCDCCRRRSSPWFCCVRLRCVTLLVRVRRPCWYSGIRGLTHVLCLVFGPRRHRLSGMVRCLCQIPARTKDEVKHRPYDKHCQHASSKKLAPTRRFGVAPRRECSTCASL